VKKLTVKDGKVIIHAVHERNISKFWDELELPESKPCYICKNPVTKKNVGAFAPIDGKVEVICEDLCCFSRFQEVRRRKAKI